MSDTTDDSGSPPTQEEYELHNSPGSASKPDCADPARIAAHLILERALADAGTTPDQAGRDGSVCVVLLTAECWAEVVRDEWQSMTRPGKRYGDGGNRYAQNGYTWLAWTPNEKPKPHSLEDLAEVFAGAVARGCHCIGFAFDPSWLPPDLVFAADHRLMMENLTVEHVGTIANVLCCDPPSECLTQDQADSLTPRLLRLARRLDQSADDYIRKLRELVDRDVAEPVVVESPRKSKAAGTSPREAPTLERLHGMPEAVAWGLTAKADLGDFKRGKISWADVDGGCLISGPPGCGKTLFARAMAASCNIPLVSGSYSQWHGTGTAHQGDLLKAMKKTFTDARAKAPCLLFLDEIDSFPNRATVTHHYADWAIQVVNALLAEIDGVEARDGVILIGACNFPEKLDPALVRSGRLDRHIRIRLPDRAALAEILREHLDHDLAANDLSGAAMAASGSTGADCERLVRGARRRARTAARDMVIADLLDEIGGADERSADDLWLAAIHEAGHAVAVTILRPGGLEMVALRGSSDSGGMTSTTTTNSVYMRPSDVKNRLTVRLAGRAAEHETFGTPSSGAGGPQGSDLAQATWLLATADTAYGFDAEAGLHWRGLPELHRLPALLSTDLALSDRARRQLDEAYAETRAFIRLRLEAVHALARALVVRRVIDGDEAEAIVRRSLCDDGGHA